MEKGKVSDKDKPDENVEGTFASLKKLSTLLTPRNRWLCHFAIVMAFCAGLLYPFIAVVMGEITGSYHPKETINGINSRLTSLFY